MRVVAALRGTSCPPTALPGARDRESRTVPSKRSILHPAPQPEPCRDRLGSSSIKERCFPYIPFSPFYPFLKFSYSVILFFC